MNAELKYADKWKLSTISFEAHVAQRVSYYSRIVGTKIKRAVRHCRARYCPQQRTRTVSLSREEMEETKASRADGKLSRGCVLGCGGEGA